MMIRELGPEEAYPMELLLLADPEEEAIQAYIARGTCYVAEEDGRLVGVYVLLPTRPGTAEIMNIAVKEGFQGRGIGRALLEHAMETSRGQGFRYLDIGTGNSSLEQLRLYQRCGFRIVGVDRNYFIKHYKEPIFENGLQCMDMIRLQCDLAEYNVS
jgi:ribosomal protein S18 acetylase RimI-like enzyme